MDGPDVRPDWSVPSLDLGHNPNCVRARAAPTALPPSIYWAGDPAFMFPRLRYIMATRRTHSISPSWTPRTIVWNLQSVCEWTCNGACCMHMERHSTASILSSCRRTSGVRLPKAVHCTLMCSALLFYIIFVTGHTLNSQVSAFTTDTNDVAKSPEESVYLIQV